MVGVHPSMPDTLDGYRILAQAEMRGVHNFSPFFSQKNVVVVVVVFL